MNLLKRRILKKIIMLLVAVTIMAAGLPAFSAYEAHVVNVRVNIEDPFSFSKDCVPMQLAPDKDDNPFTVPVYTYNKWKCTLEFENKSGSPIKNLTLFDQFQGEYIISILSHTPDPAGTADDPVISTSGRSSDVSWEIASLAPHSTAKLEIQIVTRCHCVGNGKWKQTFTSPGTWILNAGATASWGGTSFGDPVITKNTGKVWEVSSWDPQDNNDPDDDYYSYDQDGKPKQCPLESIQNIPGYEDENCPLP